MFACALYPTDQDFMDSVREEVTHQVCDYIIFQEEVKPYVSVLPFVKPVLVFLVLNSIEVQLIYNAVFNFFSLFLFVLFIKSCGGKKSAR